MKKKILCILLFSVSFVFISLIKTHSVNAQAYRGLVIDRYKYDLGTVQPGDIIHESFTLTHDFQQEDKVVTVYLKAADFTSDNTSGEPVFLAPDELPYEASLSKWITFEKESITLDHYQQKEVVNFTITIPENTEAGGKYAAVLLSDKEGEKFMDYSDSDTQVAINKELGPLVILTVDGEIHKSLTGEGLFTTDIKGKARRFFFNPPVNITAILRNDGNVHINPRGVFYIYKGSNFQKFESKFNFNEDGGYVLPNSTRHFSVTWNDSFITYVPETTEEGEIKIKTRYDWNNLSNLRIGKYKIKLLYNVEGDDGQTQTKMMDASFWVFPWQLIVIIILILLYVFWKLKKKQDEKKPTKKQKKKSDKEK
ncbi:hypothetical protein GF362_05515 [Candidatus Dojkabacteria bacterium]|nr:hypothetical protein [Candidatus Dojkabacteria bacterium]